MKLDKVDIIVSNTEEMITFYQNVFDFKMEAVPVGQHNFHKGHIKNLFEIQFVPSEFIGVDFKRNRQQFNFRVGDLSKIMKLALESGGRQEGEVQSIDDVRIFSVVDPDGNYLVFTGK